MRQLPLYISILFLSLSLPSYAQFKKDYTQYVNPFIGTGGHGHTYPGAVMPFGMVQLSPDTRLTGWDGCSGYHYSDSVVYGFSHTHLSGTGVADYCDVLFMPTTGDPKFKNTEYASKFKKSNETASPGYYSTRLDKYGIDVELTATGHVGVHRYTYPKTAKANIIIDLQHRDEVIESWIEVVDEYEVRGFRRSKSWADDQYVYFDARFSKPFKSYGIAVDDKLMEGRKIASGKNVKLFIQFDNPHEVVSRVGISSVSPEGAANNLITEVPGFDFNMVQKKAKEAWNNELSKIEVEGALSAEDRRSKGRDNIPDKKVIFYTALYHAMLAPNIYSDVDDQYRGLDGKIHTALGFHYYTVFSLWDTFRAEHPLLSLIDRKRTLDFIKSFLAMYEQGGLLPIWPLASSETFCMIGNHSIPVIVDAYAKGIRDFDAEEAFTAMKAAVNRNQFGLDVYRKSGVVLADSEAESVSKTLEYAYDDWCIAQMARMLNKTADYNEYIQRAQYWKNVYNNQNGFMQARANGGWYKPFEPTEINRNYTEGNSWQYTFLVPQDVEGLMAAMGGKDKFAAKLEELFTTNSTLSGVQQADVTGLIGQYAHGNEPSHHMAYLFNFTDEADKARFYIHKILDEEYSDKPDGLSGNEDCGQMSAWYVMSSLGLYNVTPGQQQYQIGLPVFEKAEINLENGKTFKIVNKGAGLSSQDIYLQGMKLNRKPYNKLYIDYAAVAGGGELEVATGTAPNKQFLQKLERPVSKITDDLIVANPYFDSPSRTFQQSENVEIKSADAGAKIYYTLDGSLPGIKSMLYTAPINISTNITIKAVAIKAGKSSFVDSGTYKKIRDDIKLTIVNKYLPNYADEGDNTLINGVRGKTNWRLGNWQGYQGSDLVAIIDMGQIKPVKQVSIGTLQDSRAWIVFPPIVQYWTSDDGTNYSLAATVKTKVDITNTRVQKQEFTAPLNVNARYIKLVAKQYGPLPEWHESKGSPSFIFADEITVE